MAVKFKGTFISAGDGTGSWMSSDGQKGTFKLTDYKVSRDKKSLTYKQVFYNSNGTAYAEVQGVLRGDLTKNSGKYNGTWSVNESKGKYTFQNFKSGKLISSGSFKPLGETSPLSSKPTIVSIIPSKRQINEGDALTTNISGLKKGAKLYYRIVGSKVNKSDFSAGSITGTITGSKNGRAKLSHRLKADKLTEGNESLRVQVFSDKNMKNLVGQSELVSVIDSSKRVSSSKDPVTGMFADIEGLGRVQSDKVYSKGSALSTFFQNPHATKWEGEIEFGDRRFIAMTIRATEPTQTNHPTYVTRIVIEGDFKYDRNSLVSARVDRTAQVSDGPFGWGVINSYGGVNIRNPMSASSWGASLSNPGKVTASYETNNGVQTGDLAALNGFGGGKFFYGGWEANPFASNLI